MISQQQQAALSTTDPFLPCPLKSQEGCMGVIPILCRWSRGRDTLGSDTQHVGLAAASRASGCIVQGPYKRVHTNGAVLDTQTDPPPLN